MMHNGMDITKEDFYIADDGYSIQSISVSPRIGVDYAGEAAKWPYRFFITDHPHVTPHIFNKRNY
jgi:DNA-3-methyladenine glycosylase